MADIPESTKMKACPFCGSDNARLNSPHSGAKPFVMCDDCNAAGAQCDDPITAWNTRVTSPAGQEATRAAPPAMDREAVDRKFWLIIREPGRLPDRKGPWPLEQTASILREFMAANPQSFIDYLTIGPDGSPDVDHGPEVLQMTDGRSMSVGRKHNARVREAAIDALSTLSADAIRQGEGWQPIETAVLWEVYIVTDGINTAMSQYAESDHGYRYWAVEPEDALEWEPTHCIATPASHASDGGKA